jgi:hypothetical protein
VARAAAVRASLRAPRPPQRAGQGRRELRPTPVEVGQAVPLRAPQQRRPARPPRPASRGPAAGARRRGERSGPPRRRLGADAPPPRPPDMTLPVGSDASDPLGRRCALGPQARDLLGHVRAPPLDGQVGRRAFLDVLDEAFPLGGPRARLLEARRDLRLGPLALLVHRGQALDARLTAPDQGLHAAGGLGVRPLPRSARRAASVAAARRRRSRSSAAASAAAAVSTRRSHSRRATSAAASAAADASRSLRWCSARAGPPPAWKATPRSASKPTPASVTVRPARGAGQISGRCRPGGRRRAARPRGRPARRDGPGPGARAACRPPGPRETGRRSRQSRAAPWQPGGREQRHGALGRAPPPPRPRATRALPRPPARPGRHDEDVHGRCHAVLSQAADRGAEAVATLDRRQRRLVPGARGPAPLDDLGASGARVALASRHRSAAAAAPTRSRSATAAVSATAAARPRRPRRGVSQRSRDRPRHARSHP